MKTVIKLSGTGWDDVNSMVWEGDFDPSAIHPGMFIQLEDAAGSLVYTVTMTGFQIGAGKPTFTVYVAPKNVVLGAKPLNG